MGMESRITIIFKNGRTAIELLEFIMAKQTALDAACFVDIWMSRKMWYLLSMLHITCR